MAAKSNENIITETNYGLFPVLCFLLYSRSPPRSTLNIVFKKMTWKIRCMSWAAYIQRSSTSEFDYHTAFLMTDIRGVGERGATPSLTKVMHR